MCEKNLVDMELHVIAGSKLMLAGSKSSPWWWWWRLWHEWGQTQIVILLACKIKQERYKRRQKSADSQRHKSCGPSCSYTENYMTKTLISFNFSTPHLQKSSAKLLYLLEGDVFSQNHHRNLNWKSLASGQIRDIPASPIIYPRPIISFPCLALLSCAFHTTSLRWQVSRDVCVAGTVITPQCFGKSVVRFC